MLNILFCSAGRRAELIKDFKDSLGETVKTIAVDASAYAPALYAADRRYVVSRIDDPAYIDEILSICDAEGVNAITTLIDPEIKLLADTREKFADRGIVVLAPSSKTAELCLDKYEMFKHLRACGIPTVATYGSIEEFEKAFAAGAVSFPVFAKPRCGSGSVGAGKVSSLQELRDLWVADPTLIAQELMCGEDLDADVYVDTVSHKPVRIFTKRKLETKIGGASKTVSFKDPVLFAFIENALKCFDFNGPLDMDFFKVGENYYLSEINPRFGGAYLHAYGASVDFVKLIDNNVRGVANEPCIGSYDEGVAMMMYDSVIIASQEEINACQIGRGGGHSQGLSL